MVPYEPVIHTVCPVFIILHNYKICAPKYLLLWIRPVPSETGQTMFASMCSATNGVVMLRWL